MGRQPNSGRGVTPGSRRGGPSPFGVAGNWTLVFRDEFDGSSLNASLWRVLDPSLPWGTISADPPVGTATASTYSNTADFDGVAPPAGSTPGASTSDKDWAATEINVGSGLLTLTNTLISGKHYGGGIVSRFPIARGFYEARLEFISGWSAWWFAWHGNGGVNDDFIGNEYDVAEAPDWENHGDHISTNVHTGGYAGSHVEKGPQTITTAAGMHTIGIWITDTFIRWYLDGNSTPVREILPSGSGGADAVYFDSKDFGTQYMILNCGTASNGTNGLARFDYVRHWTGG